MFGSILPLTESIDSSKRSYFRRELSLSRFPNVTDLFSVKMLVLLGGLHFIVFADFGESSSLEISQFSVFARMLFVLILF